MTQESTCPDLLLLRELLDGASPQEQEPGLTSHLENCVACQRTLERLAAGGESWEGAARELAKGPPAPDPALGRVVRDLQADGVTDETRAESAGPADLALDFLTPAGTPGRLGKLDHYEVLEVVGRGGMGVVLKALDEKLRRVVAVKVLAPQLAASSPARRRFDREARAAAAVTHEHVVAIHAVEGDRPVPYLVMQYVAGVSLQERLDRSGPLALKEVLRIGMQTAAGLAAAHAQGLVHRDVKPANILLENGVERVKLTDFGLARAVDDASVSQSGVVAGTPQYMAPEQAAGETVDHRADLFALGSVLYALCTGRPPFRASTVMAVLKRVCEEEPRPIREVNPEVPDWLAAIIAKLHAKNPDDRFQTAAEVADLLGRHLAHLQAPMQAPMPAPVAVPPAPVPDGLASWGQVLAPVAAFLIAVGAVLMILAWFTGGMRDVWIVLLWFGVPGIFLFAVITFWLDVEQSRLRRKAGRAPCPPAPPARRWRRRLAAFVVALLVAAAFSVAAAVIHYYWAAAARPVDDAWAAEVAAQPPGRQVEMVRQKLQTLNPRFNGKVQFSSDGAVVTGLEFSSAGVTDISPVRALRGLQVLSCPGASFRDRSALSDLRPLRGLKLTRLAAACTRVEDLSPLEGMPLAELSCWATQVKNLTPLRDAPLRVLDAGWTNIEDLSPLRGKDLTFLHCDNTQVHDLSPLRGLPLTELACQSTGVTDLSPLTGMPLRSLQCDSPERHAVVLRSLPELQTINGERAAAVVLAAAGPYGDISDLKINKPEDKVDAPGTPPPAGAVVLFNGKGLDGWVMRDDETKPAGWDLLPDGVIQAKDGDIITKEQFDGKLKLHVEFRVPYKPEAKGQERGNSGVYLQGRYEVQVLDSYGLDSKDNDCGAIYRVAAPLVNACKAPTVWQSYDIEFTSPKCEGGKKTAAPRITVYQNGVKVQDDTEITEDNTSEGRGGDPCTPGPIMLQYRPGNPVQFRNVWLVKE